MVLLKKIYETGSRSPVSLPRPLFAHVGRECGTPARSALLRREHQQCN
ncbi:hypothetical protein T07_1905 [Trichinella nelsoni]|uniref:Uncharacterized protein n=1 Tax=Trichinella nelsoni TaxID=6336 RepID=A0A0V0RFM4_9BILA|nr:hypothetical protein T07_1905 [Trichinella nelsoni]